MGGEWHRLSEGVFKQNWGSVIEDREMHVRQAKPGAEFYILNSQ